MLRNVTVTKLTLLDEESAVVSFQPSTSATSRLKTHSTWWLLALLLVLVAIIGFVVLKPFFMMKDYQPIDGVIIHSELEPCGDMGDSFYPAIRFSYTLGSRKYLNGQMRRDFAKMCYPKTEAAERLKQYPVGTPVQAWYDPGNPHIAVIDRSLGTVQCGFLIVTTSFAVILMIVAYFARSRQQRVIKSRERESTTQAN